MAFSFVDRLIESDIGFRRHPVPVTIALSALQFAHEAIMDLGGNHSGLIGISGATSMLIAIVAAVGAGPVAGAIVSLVGVLAFYIFVSDFGHTASIATTIAAGALWTVAAVLAGLLADGLRREMRDRRVARDDAERLHRRLEANLLPHLPDELSGCALALRYHAGELNLELGGDFCDAAMTRDGRLAIVMGDVSGHGPDAAALGATLRAAWQALVRAGTSPQTTVSVLAGVARREEANPDLFATVCLAWIDAATGHAWLLNLGHLPPLLAAGGDVTMLSIEPHPPLGTFKPVNLEPLELDLPRGWSLLFYTDGVIEGRMGAESSERFGLHRFMRTLKDGMSAGGGGGEELLEQLLAAAERAHGGLLPDDATLLLVSGPRRQGGTWEGWGL